MSRYVIDTNFYISGFQSQPNKFAKLAKALKEVKAEVILPSMIKNEMRFFLLREIVPHVKEESIDHNKFQNFLTKLYKLTANLPQKPDLSVIYVAEKLNATVVSSDLKLLETAELLGLSTLTNSAFLSLILEDNKDPSNTSYLKELENRLITAEIQYSVESTNRYDPVKRIRKIIDSAVSVIRTEYEEKLSQVSKEDLKKEDGFSMESMHLKELLTEIQTDFHDLEDDFKQGKYKELEDELLFRVQEITDSLVDWKLAVDKIEDHIIYNESLMLLGRLQYLVCICLIENKKVNLARVYMDKLLMILLQNSDASKEYGLDVHFLRMIILLLSGQIRRLNSYFTAAFEEECNQYKRADVVNVIKALILLTVVLGGDSAIEKGKELDLDNIEFINQLGFKFLQLEELHKASLMFEQTFYLSLNTKNTGFCIASLEYLSWLYFSGYSNIKPTIVSLYAKLIKKFPDIESSYQVELKVKTRPKDLDKYKTSGFVDYSELPIDFKSALYCIGVSQMRTKSTLTPIIKVMNWGMMARIAIVDENNEFTANSTLGNTIHLINGKFRVSEASSHFRKQHDVELILHIDTLSEHTIMFGSPGGWELRKVE